MKAEHDPLKPKPPGGMGRGLALALFVHVLLVVGLAIGVNWRSSNPEGLQAELWAAVPQVAAPKAAAAEPPESRREPRPEPKAKPEPKPKPKPKPEPKPEPPKRTPKPAPEPEPEPVRKDLPDPKIAIEKAKREERKLEQERAHKEEAERRKAEREEAKKAELAKAKEKAEAERVAKEKEREKEKAEKARLAKAEAEAEKKRKEDEAREAKLDKQREEAEAKRLAEAREAAVRRMLSQAGGADGEVGSRGTAARTAAPSDGYAGRVKARIKPNIVFAEQLADNPEAEILVRLAPDGRILSQKMVRGSGNKDWDQAVQRAIERTEILPRDTDGRVPSSMLIAFRPRE